jgi:hypothetical protein
MFTAGGPERRRRAVSEGYLVVATAHAVSKVGWVVVPLLEAAHHLLQFLGRPACAN